MSEQQVWTDDKFIAELSEHSAAHKNDWNAALELGHKMLKAWQADHNDLTAKLDAAQQRIDAQAAELARLRADLESSMKETGDLRQAITEAAGMPWDEMPQPFGGMGYACPADRKIVEFVARLRAQLAEAEQRVKELEGWESVGMGETVMCACGDERCYKAIEVGDRQLVVYEDVSDDDAEFVIIDLPQGVGLVRYK